MEETEPITLKNASTDEIFEELKTRYPDIILVVNRPEPGTPILFNSYLEGSPILLSVITDSIKATLIKEHLRFF